MRVSLQEALEGSGADPADPAGEESGEEPSAAETAAPELAG